MIAQAWALREWGRREGRSKTRWREYDSASVGTARMGKTGRKIKNKMERL